MNLGEITRRERELNALGGQLSMKAFNDIAVEEARTYGRLHDELVAGRKAYADALRLSGGLPTDSGAVPGTGGAPRGPGNGLRVKGSQAAPLGFDPGQLRHMYEAVQSRASFAVRTKAYNSVTDLLPSQLQGQVVGPQYEGRLIDHLPALPISAPSLEYIRHTSTLGSPAVTAEGAVKPELIFQTDPVIATPRKIAAHTGITWESLSDWDTFYQYVQSEIRRQVVDVENGEVLDGDGTPEHLSGLNTTTGILTHPVGTDTPLDAIEIATAPLRTGAALAEADLLVLNPLTWSALRREKDTQGRYLVDPDPTQAAGNKLWGVTVVPTTTQVAGVGTLLDSRKFGFIVVREALLLRTGTANDDFVANVQRLICEERLEVAVERPAAVCKITGLPAA